MRSTSGGTATAALSPAFTRSRTPSGRNRDNGGRPEQRRCSVWRDTQARITPTRRTAPRQRVRRPALPAGAPAPPTRTAAASTYRGRICSGPPSYSARTGPDLREIFGVRADEAAENTPPGNPEIPFLDPREKPATDRRSAETCRSSSPSTPAFLPGTRRSRRHRSRFRGASRSRRLFSFLGIARYRENLVERLQRIRRPQRRSQTRPVIQPGRSREGSPRTG